MPTRCIVAGCSNTSKDGVSLHFFPRDPKLRKIWTQRVRITRGNWNGPSESSAVCGAHFTADDYEDTGLYSQFNIKKAKRLKADAVPTIKSHPSASSTKSKRTSTATRSVLEKKRKMETLEELLSQPASSLEASATEVNPGEPQSSQQGQMHKQTHDDPSQSLQEMEESDEAEDEPQSSLLGQLPLHEEVPVFPHQPTQRSIRTQTARIGKRATRVKCVGITVKTKDSWMQTEEGLLDPKRPDAVSKGIMCNLYDNDSSSDSKKSSSSSSSNSPAMRQHDSDYAPDSSGSSSEEESSPKKTRKQTPRRIAQSPLDDSSAPPHLEPKYIVFESKLFELLKSCPSCGSKNVSIQKSVKGTFLKVRLECWSCNKMMRTWESQPFIQSRPAGNVLLSAAILFAGGSSTKTLQILSSIKVQTMGARTFYRHQDEFLHPIIERRWRLHQEALLSKLVEVGTPLILGGDGRADSPGHSAKYGLYSGLELTISQIVDIQLVQSNEVKSSYHMELEGYRRMHSYLTSKGLTIGKLVTDRHRQLAKHVREATPEICHMYDVWHVAKGVQKKVHALAKRKEGEVVAQWVQSITNHVYWVAASTKDEEEDLRIAKWSSLRNHIRGIHHGHSDIFPSCLHEDYGDRQKKWLRPGTAACEKLDDILTSPMLVKDIRKLSSGEQTSSLESFHSTLNHFAPKLKAYSYYGMVSRIQLAAMHFNENSKKQQATTSTGKKRFKLSKPKYKPGRASVKPVKESSSFSYVDDLLADVAMGNRLSWQGMRRKAAPPHPSPASTPTNPKMNLSSSTTAGSNKFWSREGRAIAMSVIVYFVDIRTLEKHWESTHLHQANNSLSYMHDIS